MTSGELASWVQAIASIVGIGLAFIFPWIALQNDRKTLEQERQLRRQDRQERAAAELVARLRRAEEEGFKKRKVALKLRSEVNRVLPNLERQIALLRQRVEASDATRFVLIESKELELEDISIVTVLPDEISLFGEAIWAEAVELAQLRERQKRFLSSRAVEPHSSAELLEVMTLWRAGLAALEGKLASAADLKAQA